MCDLGAGEGRHKDADRAHAKRPKVEAKRESNKANLACFLGTHVAALRRSSVQSVSIYLYGDTWYSLLGVLGS